MTVRDLAVALSLSPVDTVRFAVMVAWLEMALCALIIVQKNTISYLS